MAANRIDPFGDDLDVSDFAPRPTKAPAVPKAAIRTVSEENRFPSRAAAAPAKPLRDQRRYRTGRNVQLNTKVTQATFDHAHRLCEETGMVLGEMLERAFVALERELTEESKPPRP